MPYRVFALDSTYATAPTHATVMAALAALNAAKVNFTPTITTRQTSYDSDVVLVCVNVTDAELAADDDLINLRQANYPNAHCQHKWESLASFRISGFHALNESVRSVFAVSGRSARFIRPQQGYGETADNYGAGDGTNHFNGYNGREDTGTRQLATDYFLSGGAIMYSYDDGSDPGNAVTDATGMGAASRIREMSDPDWPAMLWSGGRVWDRASDGSKTPFELFDATNDVYVCGGFRNNGSVGSTTTYLDLDLPSSAMTLNATLLLQRYSLTGKAALSDLDGSGGQCRFHQPAAVGDAFMDAFLIYNTSTYSDVTAATKPAPDTLVALPVSAPDNSQVLCGRLEKFNHIRFRGNNATYQVGGTGVWEYSQGSDTWAAIPTILDMTNGLTQDGGGGFVYWDPPSDWATDTVDGKGPYYYVRWRKTGGTVTQQALFEWIQVPSYEPFSAVKAFDGSSGYTDYRWEANDNTADNIVAFPVSAADNAALMWCSDTPFSQILFNLSQVGIGGTFVWEYSLGSGSWDTFTNQNDPSAALTTGTLEQTFEFNRKIDWATDTVDSVTGYWVRLRKTGGTVTQAARMDFSRGYQERSIFIHRYDDQPVVNGMCKISPPATDRGKLETTGKGNIEFHRVRSFGVKLMDTDTDELFFYGCQYVLGSDLRIASGAYTWTMAAGQYGTRWWDIDDHEVQDKTQGNIPDALGRIQYAIDNRASETVNPRTGNTIGSEIEAVLAAAGITTPDLTKYDSLPDWNDFMLFGEGTYGSGSAEWTKLFGGHKYRYCGGALDGINDTRIYVKHGIDGHSDAMYGYYNNELLGSVFEQIGFERHHRAMNYYPQATGGNDKPVGGDGSTRRAIHLLYSYFTKWSGNTDDTSCNAFMLESDGDSGLYETGNGACDDIMALFCAFKDTVNADGHGAGIVVTQSNCIPVAWFNAFDNAGTCVHVAGGFSNNGPRSCYAYSYDGSYTDLTDNLKDSGNTASDLFPSGATGEKLYLGISEYQLRRFAPTITTAGVGGPTLAYRYYNGSTFTAFSGLSDGASGFTTSGQVTFTRPTDAEQTTINGKLAYWIEIEITAGSFSTIPRADEIATVVECAGIDLQHNVIRNCTGTDNGQYVIQLFQGVGSGEFGWNNNTGVTIDAYNTIYLMEGQDEDTTIYRINGVNNYSLPNWQLREKLAASSDAPQDSYYGITNTVVPFAA